MVSGLSIGRALLVCSSLLLAGCAVGPDYVPPDPTVPDAWTAAAARELREETSPLVGWWTAFDDPELTSLIERAEDANLDLRAAVARIVEARALRGIASGERLPAVGLDASYQRVQPSDNGLTPSPPGGFDAVDLYDVSVSAGWEIDVFGRIRRSIEAATAQLEATVEDWRDVRVILYADVAADYVELRTLQQRLEFARSNIEAQRDSLQLTRDRFRAGLTSALDVAEAESNLASSEAEIPLLEIGIEATLNRLAVLLGEAPGALHAELRSEGPIPSAPEELAAVLPAELLRRRPDIRRAERLLAAQTARIGVATSQLYPSFSLSGLLGVQATGGGDLGDGDSVTWALIPGLRWRIFEGGAIRSGIEAEEARAEQALVAWEQTVLRALEEVENALVAWERERVRRERLEAAVTASERSVELVRTQYLSGLTDFQRLLDAQRSLFRQQDALAASTGQVVQNLIVLNRALGGGWDPDSEETTTVARGADTEESTSDQ